MSKMNRLWIGLLLGIAGLVLIAVYARPAVMLGVMLVLAAHNLEKHHDKEKP